MKTVTKQETFNIVAKHLLTQNERAQNYSSCCYLTADGKKCAVGCLIPAGEYSPSFEGLNLNPFVFDPRLGSKQQQTNPIRALMESLGHDIGLLRDLQNIHDGYQVDSWPEALTRLAEQNNLDTDVFATI